MAGSCLHFPRSLRDMAGDGRALDSLRSARDISDGAAAVSVHDEVRAKCRLWMVFVVLHTLNTCSELFNATSGLTKPTHRNRGPPLKTNAAITGCNLGRCASTRTKLTRTAHAQKPTSHTFPERTRPPSSYSILADIHDRQEAHRRDLDTSSQPCREGGETGRRGKESGRRSQPKCWAGHLPSLDCWLES